MGSGFVGMMGIFYVLVGWISFSWQYKHILSGLLCMEVSLIGMMMSLLGGGPDTLSYLFFVILGLGVCESALGLALLVLYSRRFGNDLFSGLDCQGF
uniref:NADH-ubiquinone oxidoreductase chain 4L n=1 Tax=Spondylus violaceus TaxID=1163653 RepID=A0A515MNR6_9BIVA|nr:NADH dehydrogenase subunit 4L [Spondylus violaceus]